MIRHYWTWDDHIATQLTTLLNELKIYKIIFNVRSIDPQDDLNSGNSGENVKTTFIVKQRGTIQNKRIKLQNRQK